MKTKSKFLKIITLSLLFLVSNTIIAQTSTSPTQLVCIGSTEPYLLNPSNPTSNYQWVLSSGGTIISGQGSDAITIDWNMVELISDRCAKTNGGSINLHQRQRQVRFLRCS